ncbi:MAG: acyltransferase [Pseudomonadota bacterium]
MLNRIQAARAIAAYGVVLYHLASELDFAAEYAGPAFTVGKGGVDLFFVISGFIMVHVTRDTETPWGFFAKRVFRIVPLYWLATAAVLVLVAIRPWLVQPARVSPETIAASLSFFPMFDNNMEARPLLFLGWTLNYEMMFYLIFALCLLAPKPFRIPLTAGSLIGLMTVAPFIPHEAAALFYSQPIMLEFVAGCLIGAALSTEAAGRLFARVPAWPITALGAGLFVLAAAFPYSLPRHLLYGVPATFVVLGLAAADLHSRPIGANVLSKLGDSSYSLYLLHVLVFTVLSVVYFPLAGTSAPAQIAYALIATAAATATAALSFRYIENPSNRFLRNLWTPKPQRQTT